MASETIKKLEIEFDFMTKLVEILKSDGSEKAIGLIKSHYEKSEYKGSWVNKITDNVDLADLLLNITAIETGTFKDK